LKEINLAWRLHPASEKEAKAIRDLIRKVNINPLDLDWHRFVLAVDEQENIIACGQLKPHGAEIIELASIAVVPEWRNRGVARQVIEYLLEKAPPGPIYLTCRSGLGSLYERFGFKSIAVENMPPYYRRISRLVTLLLHFRDRDESLLVMRWDKPGRSYE
jgi:N-acetylglutamate synthase-like GNAT family acetyltransferase